MLYFGTATPHGVVSPEQWNESNQARAQKSRLVGSGYPKRGYQTNGIKRYGTSQPNRDATSVARNFI